MLNCGTAQVLMILLGPRHSLVQLAVEPVHLVSELRLHVCMADIQHGKQYRRFR